MTSPAGALLLGIRLLPALHVEVVSATASYRYPPGDWVRVVLVDPGSKHQLQRVGFLKIDMKVLKDPSMLTCTVFACPKIGGSTFRDTCSPLLRDTLTTLVTNLADAVPVSPVGIYDKYFHLEQTPHTNGMRQLSGIHLLAFRLDKGKWIENHSLDTYAEYAERLTVTTTAASSSLFV